MMDYKELGFQKSVLHPGLTLAHRFAQNEAAVRQLRGVLSKETRERAAREQPSKQSKVQGPSASEKVLETPELLSMVLEYLAPDGDSSMGEGTQDLLEALLVDRGWFLEGVRVLYGRVWLDWRTLRKLTGSASLIPAKDQVAPHRRIMYREAVRKVRAAEFPVRAGLPLPNLRSFEGLAIEDKTAEQFIMHYVKNGLEDIVLYGAFPGTSPSTAMYNTLSQYCTNLKRLGAAFDATPYQISALEKVVANASNLRQLWLRANRDTSGMVPWPHKNDPLMRAVKRKSLDFFYLGPASPEVLPIVLDPTSDDESQGGTEYSWKSFAMKANIEETALVHLLKGLKDPEEVSVLVASYDKPDDVPHFGLRPFLELRGLTVLRISILHNLYSSVELVEIGKRSPNLKTLSVRTPKTPDPFVALQPMALWMYYLDQSIEYEHPPSFTYDRHIGQLTQNVPDLEVLELELDCLVLSWEALGSLGLNCRKLKYLKLHCWGVSEGLEELWEEYDRLGILPLGPEPLSIMPLAYGRDLLPCLLFPQLETLIPAIPVANKCISAFVAEHIPQLHAKGLCATCGDLHGDLNEYDCTVFYGTDYSDAEHDFGFGAGLTLSHNMRSDDEFDEAFDEEYDSRSD